MLSSIYARINYVGKKRINVDLNWKSYWIITRENHTFQITKKPQKIYCHEIIQIVNNEIKKEIFGFETYQELEWFISLLSCRGVGSKTAMKIMKNNVNKVQQLIKEKNIDELSKLEGINKSVASYLVSNVWKPWELNKNTQIQNNNLNNNENEKYEEALEALILLGYNENQIKEALKEIEISPEIELSDIISQTIKTVANWNNNEFDKTQ